MFPCSSRRLATSPPRALMRSLFASCFTALSSLIFMQSRAKASEFKDVRSHRPTAAMQAIIRIFGANCPTLGCSAFRKLREGAAKTEAAGRRASRGGQRETGGRGG